MRRQGKWHRYDGFSWFPSQRIFPSPYSITAKSIFVLDFSVYSCTYLSSRHWWIERADEEGWGRWIPSHVESGVCRHWLRFDIHSFKLKRARFDWASFNLNKLQEQKVLELVPWHEHEKHIYSKNNSFKYSHGWGYCAKSPQL